jgi:hypothetical protein
VEYRTLLDYRRVAAVYRSSERSEDLPWSTHAVLASQPDRFKLIKGKGLTVAKGPEMGVWMRRYLDPSCYPILDPAFNPPSWESQVAYSPRSRSESLTAIRECPQYGKRRPALSIGGSSPSAQVGKIAAPGRLEPCFRRSEAQKGAPAGRPGAEITGHSATLPCVLFRGSGRIAGQRIAL